MSLNLKLPMDKMSWQILKRTLKINQILSGKIVRHEVYGAYVDLGLSYEGLIQITDMVDMKGFIDTKNFPPIGKNVETVVLGFKENNQQIWLSIKPSKLEKARRLD